MIDIVSRRAWIIASGLCLLAAVVTTLSAELFVHRPNPLVHVRWRESLDADGRTALARRFHLEGPEQVGPATWRYELTDTSRENVGGLVEHPDVADTHSIDRSTFEIQSDAAPAARRPGPLGRGWPRLAVWLADHGPAVLLALAATAVLAAVRPQLVSAPAMRSLLTGGIPPLSPAGFTAFRLIFGLVLALYVYAHPFPRDVMTPDLQRPDVHLAEWAPIRWLVEHPPVVRLGQWIAIVSAVFFAVGILSRILYVVVVVGIMQWLLAFSVQSDSHPFGVLMLPLLCLLVVPWSDAPPLFRLFGPHPPSHGTPDSRYGYAPWLLSFALGVAWAAAAWAKLREGPGWILNGTVRYHFVSDASHAPVDWGLTVATMPVLAVVLSGGAVLVEALALPVAFLRAPMLRLAMGLVGMSVLAGFYLFQGIYWPAWWVLLLGFLPWQWFDRRPAAAGGRLADPAAPRLHQEPHDVSRGQFLCILGLALQQLVVSAAFIEFPPMASRYDMYSKTHASPEDYDRENPHIGRHIVAEDSRGIRTDLTECASELREPIWAALGALDPADPPPSTAPLRACHADGPAPVRYLLTEEQCLFNWKTGQPYCVYRDKLIATLAVSDGP